MSGRARQAKTRRGQFARIVAVAGIIGWLCVSAQHSADDPAPKNPFGPASVIGRAER